MSRATHCGGQRSLFQQLEGIEERVVAHQSVREGRSHFLEEGHDVERATSLGWSLACGATFVTEDTMSIMVKLAIKTDESASIDVSRHDGPGWVF